MDFKIEGIAPADAHAVASARRYIDALAKPLGSLGELEAIVEKLRGYWPHTARYSQQANADICADNGVHAQGISPVPQSVTRVQAINIANGLTGVGRLAECALWSLRRMTWA